MITVLLVDDEVAANHRMAEMLAAFPIIQVIGAVTSVAHALAFIRKEIPNVIFLDVEMPGGARTDHRAPFEPNNACGFCDWPSTLCHQSLRNGRDRLSTEARE